MGTRFGGKLQALVCHECGSSTGDGMGWIAQVVVDSDDARVPAEAVVYCPACAEREFEYVSARVFSRSVKKPVASAWRRQRAAGAGARRESA
ncbi:MAG TPA: hypothetical protein VHQ96_03330 [Gaiellaceae bacterium]|nr:hypothetical protein [Gaiellaceae bacterium]